MRTWSTSSASERRRTIGLVPTMGALHRGPHRTDRAVARAIADVTVVSIFVNPLQFDRADDFDRYPRPIDADLAACADLGVDAVYAPLAARCTRRASRRRVSVGALSSAMEGAARPGHFDGVTTVVTKLFTAVRPGPRRVRREGLPAAGHRAADDRRPRSRRRRDRPSDRARTGRPGDVEPEHPARRRPTSCRRHHPHGARPRRFDRCDGGERSTAAVISLVRRTIDREPTRRPRLRRGVRRDHAGTGRSTSTTIDARPGGCESPSPRSSATCG